MKRSRDEFVGSVTTAMSTLCTHLKNATLLLLICGLLSACSTPKKPNKTPGPALQATSTPLPAQTSTPAPGLVHGTDDIKLLWINKKIEGKESLFILLDRDGSMNRQGSGTASAEESVYYIGMHPGLFQQVLESLNDDFMRHMGGYKSKEIKGAVCELEVGFEFTDGTNGGFFWQYGLESEGPPEELRLLVTRALELTDPIYAETVKKQGAGTAR